MTEPVNEGGWHFVEDGPDGRRAVGPVTTDQIVALIRERRLQHGSLVWREGMKEWATLGQTPELAETLPAPPTSPTIPLEAIARSRGDPIGDNLGMRLLLPVGRSAWAIAAGYLGLFSVLAVPAPLALFTGIMAVREIRAHEHIHGMGRAVFGIVMGAGGTLVLVFMLFAMVMGAR